LGLSWLAVYLLPMMVAVQETVARIVIVTQTGLAHVIGRRDGRRLLYPLALTGGSAISLFVFAILGK
jgi:Mn2+/Fe2+ NRAMP family transporter